LPYYDSSLTTFSRAENITFNDDALAVGIAAQHLNFGPYEAETAHTVTIHTSSLRQLKKRHEDRRFYVTHRLRRGLEEVDGGISQSEGERAVNGPDDIFPTKPIDDILPTSVLGDFTSAIGSVPTSIAGDIGEDIKKFGSEKMHELLKKIEEKTAFKLNKTANIDFDVNWDDINGTEKHRLPLTDEIGKFIAMPQVNLVNTFANVNLDVSVGMSFNIAGAADMLLEGEDMSGTDNIFSKALQDLYVQVETVEDVRLGLQAEFLGKVGAVGFCLVWFYPVPGSWSCSAGPIIGMRLYNELTRYRLT
jgi:hypothetical protein